jgi:hypothetical protein
LISLIIVGCATTSDIDASQSEANVQLIYRGDTNSSSLSDITTGRNAFIVETNDETVIGRIDRIVQYDTTFIALDNMNQVIGFSDKGKHLFTIHNVGQGPGEYSQIWDITVDNSTHELLVLADMKICHYSLSGKFTGIEDSLTTYLTEIASDSSANYSRLNTESDNKSAKWLINVTNNKTNTSIDYIKPLHEYAPYCNFAGRFMNTSRAKGVTMTRKFDSNLYKLRADTFQVAYNVDWGTSKFTPTEGETYECDDIFRRCLNTNEVYAMFNWQFGDSIITFSTNVPGLYYTKISDKQVYRIPSALDTELNIPISNWLAVSKSDGLIFATVDYMKLKRMVNIPIANKENINNILSQMTDDSNALFIFYKLK